MVRFRILPGLPPYGPLALPFSEIGQGAHREGLVVEFEPDGEAAWSGNFQRGLRGCEAVAQFPDSDRVLVVARGQGYVIDPAERRCVRMLTSDIDAVFVLADRIILSDGLTLEAITAEGRLWRTRRISWDGFAELRVAEDRAVGVAFNPISDAGDPFVVELATGKVEGGSFRPG